MNKHSKHTFTYIVILLLCVVAIVLWSISKSVLRSTPGFGTGISPTENVPAPSGSVIFTAGDGSFTFTYPGDLTFSDTPARVNGADTDTVTFKSSDALRTFTIQSSPYNSSDTLNAAKIKADIPDLDMQQSEEIAVDGSEGVSFLSRDPSTGVTSREVWFAHNGTICQIQAPPAFSQELVNILSTWKW